MVGVTLSGLRTATALARMLPRHTLPGAARLAGALGAVRSRDATEMLERHLARVDPTLTPAELAAASRAGIDSYARYWIETLRLAALADDAVDAGFRNEGYDPHITTALQRGNGVILALPHLGGWEWAGRWLAQRGHRVTAVVERLEPPEVYQWFVGMRRAIGIDVVPVGRGSGRSILAALKRNEIVALMCDRDLARTGVDVRFFGAMTTLPAGPAMLSRRSGAPVLPTAVYFTDRPDGHFALVRPPLQVADSLGGLRAEVASLTQQLAGELEMLIRRAPEQWHLLQPNWPDDPGYTGSGSVGADEQATSAEGGGTDGN